MSTVEFEHVTKRFGDVVAVDDVSLSIADGEFLTLVGPSGCGKTTTLRLLAGFETVTEGRMLVGGDDITHSPPYKRDIGMVFQSFALFPHLTVGENIAYGLRESTELSDREIRDKVDHLLEVIQLPDIHDRDPAALSGGQQQRVALARALAIEPQVLLLDEPLASLDKKLREQMQVELRQLHNELDITTVFVTHNQREAMSMSDRIAVMRDGSLVQVGTPHEVYQNPRSPFVADFIGTSNVFDGHVTATRDGAAVVRCSPGLDVRCQTDGHVAEGDAVTISFRPRAVKVASTSAQVSPDGGRHNTFSGEIAVQRYFGESIEYHVTVGEKTIISHVQSENVVDEFEMGDRVTVHVPSTAVRIFPTTET